MMRRILSLPFVVLLACILPVATHAQSWTGVLSTARAISWGNAGLPATLPDGETTPNPWTPPTRTQSGSTVNPSGVPATDLTNINNALTACTNGHYVLLGSGTFLIQGTVDAHANSCTLRGSGAQSTILHLTGAGQIWMGEASGANSCTLTAGSNYSAGSTSITCNGLAGTAPVVGDIVQLIQCDTGFSGSPCTGTSADNGGLFVCSFNTTCMTEPSGGGLNNSQQQNFVLTSVSNASGTYTLGLNHPIYMPNWSHAQTAALSWNSPSANGIGVGVEDMTIYFSGTSTNNWSLSMQNTYASWVKGVRFLGTPVTNPLAIQASENGLVFDNYCVADVVLDANYPGCLHSDTSSDILILNNILTSGNYEADGGDAGEVDAYNYDFYYFTLYPLDATVYDHHAFDSFRLEEGNEAAMMYSDDTWGTHALYTIFRNYLACNDTPYGTYSQAQNQIAFSIGGYQRFHNAIGNAVGTTGQCTTYQGSSATVVYRFTAPDALTSASFMRWGNVSVVTQSTDTPTNSGVRFVASEVPTSTVMPSGTYPNAVAWQNTVPGNDSLPCSFFLAGYTSTTCTAHPSGGTGLSWWKVCTAWTTFPTSCASSTTQPFPFAGPDVVGGAYVNGHAYDNSAATAWKNLPIDTIYQNSYTVTSSSWSGGTETLTISSLPNVTHLMGAFQLSGANSACSTGATFGASNEILMTGSSSIAVQYALASNPGVSCAGSFKFPDVREFDESVYQSDSSTGSGSGQLLPPATINATVQP